MAEVGVTCGFELAGELLEPDTCHFAQIALLQPVFQVPPRLFSQVPPAINLLLDLAEKLADVGPALIEVLVVLAELLRMPLHLGDPLCALLVFIPHLPTVAQPSQESPRRRPPAKIPRQKRGHLSAVLHALFALLLFSAKAKQTRTPPSVCCCCPGATNQDLRRRRAWVVVETLFKLSPLARKALPQTTTCLCA